MTRVVRVRIALAVDAQGRVATCRPAPGGGADATADALATVRANVGPGGQAYWVDVDLPVPDLPAARPLAAVVTPAEP